MFVQSVLIPKHYGINKALQIVKIMGVGKPIKFPHITKQFIGLGIENPDYDFYDYYTDKIPINIDGVPINIKVIVGRERN